MKDFRSFADVFLFDRVTGVSILVSHAADDVHAAADAQSYPLALSPDGNLVLFRSEAGNLISGMIDGNDHGEDLYLFDRLSGTTVLVSRSAAAAHQSANQRSEGVAISANGQFVLFNTEATDVVAGLVDPAFHSDAFLFDRNSGTVSLVSPALGSPGTTPNEDTYGAALSADGQRVLLRTLATDLRPGSFEPGSGPGIYVFDRPSNSMTLVTGIDGSQAVTTGGDFYPLDFSRDGTRVVFSSTSTNLLSNVFDINNGADAFMADVQPHGVFADGLESP
jgi:hypothetical protein